MSLPQASLQKAADERKARLLALKKRKAGESEDGQGGEGEKPQFTFKPRNFDPLTRQPIKRQKTILEQQQADEAGEEAEEIDGVKTGVDSSLTVEDRVRGVAERVIAEDERKRGEELDLLNIAPKRANWDLKRDMERRSKKLKRKTEECYSALFRQRLQSLRQQASSTNSSSLPPSAGADLLANMQAAEEQNRRQVRADDDDVDMDDEGEME